MAKGSRTKTTTTMAEQGLDRSALARQLLLRREPVAVAETVRRVVAVQAQTPASPCVALWNRFVGIDPADLDAESARGTVVRSNAVRLALPAYHVEDHRVLREATEPSLRAAKLGGESMASGHTVADAAVLVPELGDPAGAASARHAEQR